MAQSAQLQLALIAHDRALHTTDILLFYGRKGKDTISPQQLVDQLEKVACVTGWDMLQTQIRENAMSFFSLQDNECSFMI